jgi:hypothetical protein
MRNPGDADRRENLGDPRDKDIRNCVPCDVNQIKKALKEAQ